VENAGQLNQSIAYLSERIEGFLRRKGTSRPGDGNLGGYFSKDSPCERISIDTGYLLWNVWSRVVVGGVELRRGESESEVIKIPRQNIKIKSKIGN
jgi:hypothetical protein